MLCKLPSIKSVLFTQRFANKKLLYITLWIIFITIFFSIPASKLVGYILPVIGPIALLMAVGADYFIESGITKRVVYTQSIVSIFMFCAAIAMFLYPAFQHKFSAATMYVYFIPGGIAFIAGSIISFIFTKQNKLLKSVITITISMVIFNICALLSVPIFDVKTAQPLTTIVKPMLKKDSIVVAYDQYSEDIPLLLKRKVYVAYPWREHSILNTDNWAREFYFGIHQYQSNHHKWPKWYIELTQFPMLWKNHNSVFVYTSKGEYEQLVKKLHLNTRLIAEYRGNVFFKKEPEP